jgi:hypothetical protein
MSASGMEIGRDCGGDRCGWRMGMERDRGGRQLEGDSSLPKFISEIFV